MTNMAEWQKRAVARMKYEQSQPKNIELLVGFMRGNIDARRAFTVPNGLRSYEEQAEIDRQNVGRRAYNAGDYETFRRMAGA